MTDEIKPSSLGDLVPLISQLAISMVALELITASFKNDLDDFQQLIKEKMEMIEKEKENVKQ